MDACTDPRLLPFQYHLSEERIARFPPAERDGGRLLVLGVEEPQDALVSSLASHLRPGDLVVVNDTGVVHARLKCRRQTGAKVEVFLLPSLGEGCHALVRPSRRLREGERLEVLGRDGCPLNGSHIDLIHKAEKGEWRLDVSPSPEEVMAAAGEVPIPPYFKRDSIEQDESRYQTLFAATPGAVAAPTAGLHFSAGLLSSLKQNGIGIATVTLHVGAGTFRTLGSENLDSGELHPEPYWVSQRAVDAIEKTKQAGGRVLAVGTTVTRCLESAAVGGLGEKNGTTRLFIREGHPFQVIDGLLTNFHLPCSSLLMLVCAFGGRERVMAAYRHAIDGDYSFYSYGDAMLLWGQCQA
jgi:S-adenosylmethionine:tRNA ribosyltransferase-isomerase